MSGYSHEELKLIATGLAGGLSAAKIAEQVSIHRHAFVSRNGIIGIVHRTPALKAIGFERIGNGRCGGAPAGRRRARQPAAEKSPRQVIARGPKVSQAKPPKVREAKQNLNSGNIANKKDSHKNDPGFVIERIKPPVAEAAAYDLASRRVVLTALGKEDCRFAVNDAATGEQHLFCGAVTEAGSPYCRHHAMRAFNGRTHMRAEPFAPKRVAFLASFVGGA